MEKHIKFSDWFQLREEHDACYHKVKARYRVWPSAYACVPTETSKALTKEGWKHYQQLSVGDEILTYSMEKDCLEFQQIKNLYFYEDADTYVVKNGNTGWKFECTPNHKWVVKHPKCNGSRGRKKYSDLKNDMRLATTEELLSGSGSNRKLVISAKYYGGQPIELDKVYKYQTNWIEYLLNCSPEQRQSWLYSAIVYDGHQLKTQRLVAQTNETDYQYQFDTPHGKQSFGFKQKDINHRDAFLISAFLNKGLVTFKKHKNANIFNCHYVAYNGTKSWEGFRLIEKRTADVWCPQTENGTWVMMQETDGNGTISITGNSGALVRCRKVGAANWGNKTRKMQAESDNYLTREDIHKLADSKGLKWDNEPSFLKKTKQLTGKEHLDELNQNELKKVKSWLDSIDENFDSYTEDTFKLEKERGLKGWFDRNKGKGWIDCKASKKGKLVPCGRQKTGKGADRAYPACRPTLGACNKKGTRRKKSSKRISWE